jgi:hypothetical protein
MNGAFRVVYSGAVQTALHELLSRATQADRQLGRNALAAGRSESLVSGFGSSNSRSASLLSRRW